MNFLKEAFEKIINEGFEGKKLYVYHMTKPDAIKNGICVGGFERWFSGDNSNFYGPGIYTCIYPAVDPRSRVSRGKYFDMSRGSIYGRAMLKCEADPNLSNFVIYDEILAKKVYGKDWEMEKQFEKIFPDSVIQYMKSTPYHSGSLWGYCTKRPEMYTSGVSLKALWENVLKVKREANAAVRGLIYWGNGDGYVAIFRDYTACKPVAVSYDYGETFQPIAVSPKFYNYSGNNIDIWRALKLDAGNPNDWRGRFYDEKTYRKIGNSDAPYDYLPPYFFGDFVRVKKDGKSNYLWRKTFKKGPISNIWFDECPERFKRSGTEVIIDGRHVLLKQMKNDGFYVFIPQYQEGNDEEVFISSLPYYTDKRYEEARDTIKKYEPSDFNSTDNQTEQDNDDDENVMTLDDSDFSW